MSRLSELNTKYAEFKKVFQDNLQEQVKLAFTDFFEAYPEIKAIYWTQYTPYFNDGEPCTFGRHDFFYVTTNEAEEAEVDDEDIRDLCEDEGSENFSAPDSWVRDRAQQGAQWAIERIVAYDKTIAKYGPRYAEIGEGINKFFRELDNVDSEIYEAMFGDGVKVIATKNGFDTEEYSHD